MNTVEAILKQAAADLNAIGARWALIGGLAVAFRAELATARLVRPATGASSAFIDLLFANSATTGIRT